MLRAIAIFGECLPTDRIETPSRREEGSPLFPYHRPRTYSLFCPRGPSSSGGARFGNWQNATMVRALINGAPVAAPVTMQFALRARAVHAANAADQQRCLHRGTAPSPFLPFAPSSPARARVLSQRSDKAVTRVTR